MAAVGGGGRGPADLAVAAVAAAVPPGIGNPGGNQLPLKHVQSGPGWIVVHDEEGGGGGGGGAEPSKAIS